MSSKLLLSLREDPMLASSLVGRAHLQTIKPVALGRYHSMDEAQAETDVLSDARHAADSHKKLSVQHRFMREALIMVK